MSIKNNTASLRELLEAVNNLPDAGSVELPELTNEGSAADLLNGKQLINGDGNVVTGTMTNNGNLYVTIADFIETNADEREEPSESLIYNIPEGYHEGEGIVTINKGFTALPTISVNSSGLITAVATTTTGYVTAETQTSTHQLAFQAAKTITPSTASQIAVSSGYYTGGNITVKGDANLVAGNIKSGVSIFGVSGTLVAGGGGSGGDTSAEDGLVTRSLTSYTNDRAKSIGSYAFAYCTKLTTVSFPVATSIGISAFYSCYGLTTVSFPVAKSIDIYAFAYCASLTTVSFPVATSIGSNAFRDCTSLTTVSFPVATSIGSYAFAYCASLTTVSFPVATSIGSNAFRDCTSLTTVSFPVATSIGNSAFYNCYSLSSLTLGASTICTLSYSKAFLSTPYAGYSSYFSGTPYIYVPASLVNSYKTATNWVYFSKYFSAIESSGGDERPDMITFTIDEIEYQAEEGMTWGEWVESNYNICEARVNSGNMFIIIGVSDRVIDGESGEFIVPTDKIIKNYSYQTM